MEVVLDALKGSPQVILVQVWCSYYWAHFLASSCGGTGAKRCHLRKDTGVAKIVDPRLREFGRYVEAVTYKVH